MYQLDKYRKFLMNRVTTTQSVIEYIENCLVTEDEVAKHSFHKIMIQNWADSDVQLFEVLSEYFGAVFVPVNYTTQNILTTFHTSSLLFVLKIIKLDFMFPFCRNMFNVDILFNDKTSCDCFQDNLTIDDIVSKVVSCRFNQHFELDLSDFCNDSEFIKQKIRFYKLTLLSYFKLLMIRMGRDTKTLNLSNNKLSQIPSDILNFFIKGDLIGVNLSNNNIPSVSELHRISSKIEKLWAEGNPLCEDMEPMTYIKQISQKFPRLSELDGIKLNEHGMMIPFYSNFLVIPDKRTKIMVEKFVSLYFAHYDTKRQKINMFYSKKALLTINVTFSGTPESMAGYTQHSRNILQKNGLDFKYKRLYKSQAAIVGVLTQLPPTTHDPRTLSVDVLKHDKHSLILVLEGVYKERGEDSDRFMHFRRTFVFEIHTQNEISYYAICNEMFTVSFATPEMEQNGFKHPVRNLNQLSLIEPDREDREALILGFMHFTQLKKSDAEARLLYYDWDFRLALKTFITDLKNNKISEEKLMEDDMTDLSSILSDEVD